MILCVLTFLWLSTKILLFEVPIEGKEKKKKKVLLATKIQAGGDKSKSILDYVDTTVRPVTNAQGFIGECQTSVQYSVIMTSQVSHDPLLCEGKSFSLNTHFVFFREARGASEKISP